MSSLPASEIAYEEAHINENKGPLLIVLCTIFTGVTIIIFCLRLIARRVLHTGIARDDWFAFIAMVFLVGLNITACLLGSDGIGRHLIWVEENEPDDFNKIRIVEIAFSFLYVFCLCFSKLSVLSLYARMFSHSDRLVRWSIWFFTGYTIVWAIAVQIAMGTATNINTSFEVPWPMTIAVGVTNVVGDVGVLLIPQPVIWKLQQSFRARMFLSGVFFMGIFAILVGIIRIPLLNGLPGQSHYDKTWTGFESILFSVIEPAVVLACCCAPPAAGLFRSRKSLTKPSYRKGSSQGYLRPHSPAKMKNPNGVVDPFKTDQLIEWDSVEAFELDRRAR